MSYRAINATTVTLVDLLAVKFAADALLRPLFDSGLGGSLVVSARTPQEMSANDTSGLSIWLYHIARDPELLNMPPRRTGPDTWEERPLPLRLHYLITPVVNGTDNASNDAGLEQLVIGKVLQTMHDTPTLQGSLLRGDLSGSGTSLSVRLEPLGLEEITRVWDALESSYQLCVSYEVSLVLVNSDKQAERVTPVSSIEPSIGVLAGVQP